MNIPDEEVQRSLAICLRSMEEHIPRDEPIYPHVERCVEWLCALPIAPEPDWSKAPEWAMWWAVDANDISRFWEHKPWRQRNRWNGRLGKLMLEMRIDKDHEGLPEGIDWRTTLRKRPEEK